MENPEKQKGTNENSGNNDKIDTTINEDGEESASLVRNLTGWKGYLFTIIAITGALFHIYVLNFHPIDPWIFRSTHLTFGAVLGFLLYAGWKGDKSKIHWVDWLLILATIYVGSYIFLNIEQIQFRFGVAPTGGDILASVLGLIVVFELVRRVSGLMLPLLALVFVFYAFAGPYLPGILNHQGYSVERFITYVFGLDGVFGVTLDVSSKYIVLFIIFGAFLQISKVGQFFIDFAFSVAGRLRGGPAKVSVIASALMGTMNGTSAGNVVTTGPLTIPLMRKTGYRGRSAAAIEATASTGGQLLPPIMGAGAFLMAEIIGVPYQQIIIAAIIPAALYFISVYFMVDFEAQKNGMKGLAGKHLPKMKSIIKRSYLSLPLILIVFLLLSGYSIIFAGTAGIIGCFLVSLLRKDTRMGIKQVLEALELGMKNSIQLIAIVACAGIIVGVISLTGVGMRFGSMLMSLAGTSLILALIFAAGIAVILGMGMPTTAAYAVAASVVAPGLVNIGIEPLISHFFVFFFAVVSAITPPVALAAYAGAGIAGTDPMKTSFVAFKLGIASFIIPFMFIYSPELLLQGGTIGTTILAVVTSLFGVYLLAAATQSWFFKASLNWLGRVILLTAAFLLMLSGFITDLIGLFLVIGVGVIQKVSSNSTVNSERKAMSNKAR